MVKDHAEEIRWKVTYAISNKGLFGTSDKKQLFGNHDYTTTLNLYFDGAGGSIRSIDLMKKVMETMESIENNIQGGLKATIPKKLQKYLSIEGQGSDRKLVCDYQAWQNDMDGKGFFSIADSFEGGALNVHNIYHKRDASETQYMILKTMEGYDVTRVHSMAGVQAKHAVCFVGSIIRNRIMLACKEKGQDTNQALKEINRIKLQLTKHSGYHPVINYSERQKAVLSVFEIYPDSFDAIAKEATHRYTSNIHSQTHKMPTDIIPKTQKRGRPPKAKATDEPKKKPGRPRKNPVSEDTQKTKLKRGRGRPVGSLNKKTLEKIARGEIPESKPKRGRGRPPGSLNKKTLQRMAQSQEITPKPERGRGRPPGSLNKKTIERIKQQNEN